MATLLSELRHQPLLWLLAFVPAVFVVQSLEPEAHTLLFVLSVLWFGLLALFAVCVWRWPAATAALPSDSRIDEPLAA